MRVQRRATTAAFRIMRLSLSPHSPGRTGPARRLFPAPFWGFLLFLGPVLVFLVSGCKSSEPKTRPASTWIIPSTNPPASPPARLESANKQLKTTVLVSGPAREHSTLNIFRPIGRISVSGRSTPIEIFEPVPDLSSETVTRLTTLHAEFDKGDVKALEELERYASEHQDAAIANLVYRLKQVGPGGNFVLDSK